MSEYPQRLDEIADRIRELINAETAVVAIAESDGEIVHYAAAVGKHAASIRDKRGPSATSGLCGTAFESHDSVLVCKTQGDLRVRQDLVKALGITTALAVPLYYENRLLGALMAFNCADGTEFDAETETVLVAYAAKAAPLIWQYLTSIA